MRISDWSSDVCSSDLPERIATSCAPLDLVSIGRLDFEAPDEERFPAIRIAREAIIEGGTCPAILNAANEVAVEAFLKEKISFLEIATIVTETLNRYSRIQPQKIEDIFEEDRSEEHTSELQSLMRISYAALC